MSDDRLYRLVALTAKAISIHDDQHPRWLVGLAREIERAARRVELEKFRDEHVGRVLNVPDHMQDEPNPAPAGVRVGVQEDDNALD